MSEGGSAEHPAGTRPVQRRVAVLLAAAVGLGLVALAVVRWGAGGTPAAAPRAAPSSAAASRPPTTAEIYSAVAPSVVSIEAGHDSGTGIVVNADGTILTALHVVKGVANGAGAIRVTFADGTVSAARVTSADPGLDIATLAPAALPSVLVPAVLGSAGRLAVGDSVVAIGNPLGLTLSTTTGVVSGLDRQATANDGGSLSGLIQFDAAVNPGSSGGPLLNARGETVGIVVALANPTSAGTFIGVGFAVPIGTAVAGGGGAPQQ